jgi:diamine N-acetyltransferase
MNVSFKTAEESDTLSLINMMEEFYEFFGYPFDKESTQANLFMLIRDKSIGYVWLILSENIIIGYVVLTFAFSFEFKGRTAFIDELFLKTAYRAKGIGRTVIEFVEEKAKNLGVRVIHLEVEKDNIQGQKLYLSKGFVDNNRKLLTKYLS